MLCAEEVARIETVPLSTFDVDRRRDDLIGAGDRQVRVGGAGGSGGGADADVAGPETPPVVVRLPNTAAAFAGTSASPVSAVSACPAAGGGDPTGVAGVVHASGGHRAEPTADDVAGEEAEHIDLEVRRNRRVDA